MATANPFDLLGDDDNGDPTSLVNIAIKPSSKEKPTAKNKQQSIGPAKLPTRPLPPAEAVTLGRNTQNDGGRGRGGRGFGNKEQDFGYGRGRSGGSYNGRENYGNDYQGPRGVFYEGDDGISGRREEGEAVQGGRGRGGGGRVARGYGGRSPFGDAGADDTRRRVYERRSGTGRGTEMKREGAGRGNWGTPVNRGTFQEIEELLSAEDEKIATSEKHPENEDKQEIPVVDTEKKKEEEEDKEMTLDEYEKILEDRRRTILVTKFEERKVDAKEFESMQQLLNKKNDDEFMFIKSISEKDRAKKNEAGERDEKIRKPMSINEFLKPAEGERYYGRGRGRERGRGRGEQGGFKGGFDSAASPHQLEAPSIEDPGQFPSLGGK